MYKVILVYVCEHVGDTVVYIFDSRTDQRSYKTTVDILNGYLLFVI
jgi:hypothetical protein